MSEKIKVSALEIYEGAFDSAQSEYIPEDFAGQIKYIQDYAEGVWNITLTDQHAETIANCRKSLLEANEKDGQWTFNYDYYVYFELQDIEYDGDSPTED